jgi:acetyl/propionyl-CoA carboxylase alpha subunit
MPAGPGVRVDTGLQAGDRVPPDYDNLVAKIMVHAADRDAAIDRLRRALDETEIAGIQTTLPFDRFVAGHPGFRAGDLSIEWVAEAWDGAADRARHAQAAAEAAARAVAAGRVSSAAPAPATPTTPGGSAGAPAETAWAVAARHDATDRWPG